MLFHKNWPGYYLPSKENHECWEAKNGTIIDTLSKSIGDKRPPQENRCDLHYQTMAILIYAVNI